MIGYKAFNKGLICRRHQYEAGKTYEMDGQVELCSRGYHYCENPLDVLDYYDLTTSEFAEVQAEAISQDKNKSVTNKITITAKLELPAFIKAAFNFLWERNDPASSGDNSKLASSGDNSKLASSGDYSKLASSGDNSQLASSGDYSKLVITGANSVAANVGYKGQIKGVLGSWITLAEYDDTGVIKVVKTAVIDGKKLHPNVFYSLVNGKFKAQD